MTNNFDDDNTLGVGGYGKVLHFFNSPIFITNFFVDLCKFPTLIGHVFLFNNL
jgi:hypothetical protein